MSNYFGSRPGSRRKSSSPAVEAARELLSRRTVTIVVRRRLVEADRLADGTLGNPRPGRVIRERTVEVPAAVGLSR